MGFRVEVKPHAEKAIKKLDLQVARVLRHWIFVNLQNTDNPRRQGKALQGSLKGYRRYVVAEDYRLIVKIEDKTLIIFVLETGHRKTVYDKFKRYLGNK